MAAARKARTVRGDGRGDNSRASYAEFMRDLLRGDIQATALHDSTTSDGTIEVATSTEAGPATVTHTLRRLLSLEYDDPDGRPGVGRGGADTRA